MSETKAERKKDTTDDRPITLTIRKCESYLIHMKKATVRDLRTRFPRIEGWLQEGETVTITKRHAVIALLSAPPAKVRPDFARRFREPRKRATPHRKGAVDLLLEERGE
jgi:antitoxin (DNA-binding transcriptional repressor) of toxin-antitoxin stability system